MSEMSFIVPTCLVKKEHLILLKKCLNSIVEYSNYKNIYLINGSDDSYIDEINSLQENIKNLIIKKTSNKGSEDQQVFNLVLELENIDDNQLFFIMQDSMFLNKKIDNYKDIDSLKFIWHFTNHHYHWDNIYEPKTEFNIKNNITTHTDLIKFHILNFYNKDPLFLNYVMHSLKYKNNWCGCFGNCCIINKKTIKLLNDKTNFAKIFISNVSNRERRMNESIFALICHYYLPANYEDSYDGIYYDGITINKYNNKPFLMEDTVFLYCVKKDKISKVSFNR